MMSVVLTEIRTQVWCYRSSSLFLFRCDAQTGVVVRVSLLSKGGGNLHTGGRCEAIVLFLAVSFLSVCVEGVSRFA
jgi:hypothetical protein